LCPFGAKIGPPPSHDRPGGLFVHVVARTLGPCACSKNIFASQLPVEVGEPENQINYTRAHRFSYCAPRTTKPRPRLSAEGKVDPSRRSRRKTQSIWGTYYMSKDQQHACRGRSWSFAEGYSGQVLVFPIAVGLCLRR